LGAACERPFTTQREGRRDDTRRRGLSVFSLYFPGRPWPYFNERIPTMTDLFYTITIEVQKPPGLLGPVPAAKVTAAQGRLYEGEDPAEQLKRQCAGLVDGIAAKLRKAAGAQV
jgi:hypothetical protein